MHHPNKDALIAGLQSKHPCTPYIGESEQVITLRAVRNISQNVMSLLPEMLDRRLDELTIPNFVILKGGSHGARHVDSEAQRENHHATHCLRKAHTKKFDSILQRYQEM